MLDNAPVYFDLCNKNETYLYGKLGQIPVTRAQSTSIKKAPARGAFYDELNEFNLLKFTKIFINHFYWQWNISIFYYNFLSSFG